MANTDPGTQATTDLQKKTRITSFFTILGLGLGINFLPTFIADNLAKAICLAGILAGLVIVAVAMQRKEQQKQHVPLLTAIATGCCISIPQAFWGGGSTVEIKVLNVLFGVLFCVITFLLAAKLLRKDPGSLLLRKGNLKIGLAVGLIAFGGFFASAIPAATFLFGGRNVTWDMMVMFLPWIIAFVFMNAVREELWFRATCLAEYGKYLGLNGANWVQAIIFTLAHSSPSLFKNPGFAAIYMGVIIVLGLGFGATMQKSGSVLGAILFHAGSDTPVILAAFSLVI